MSFTEDLKKAAAAISDGATPEQREAILTRLATIELAIEHLFTAVPSGQTARANFIDALDARARAAENSPHEAALLAELDRWKGRRV